MSPPVDPVPDPLEWDIYCKIVDNYGDVGVCWRLAVDLADRGQRVRLFLTDPTPLHWMAPNRHPRVEIVHWRSGVENLVRDVVIAAFSCELDQATLQAIGARFHDGNPCVWIQLEYLSAESFSARSHGCAAPVLHGPAAGAPRFAFYPGFTETTGGLLRAPDLLRQQAAFDPQRWLAERQIRVQGQTLMSMFCYEPPMLPKLLQQLAGSDRQVHMLVCAGRTADAVRQALPNPPVDATISVLKQGSLTLTFLPPLTQTDYDHLLWSCQLNFVRGEDSLVRAIWAGQAFVWQAYPQDDGAHLRKLDALLAQMHAPTSLRNSSKRWNDGDVGPAPFCDPLPDIAQWRSATRSWRDTLLIQADLVTQLVRFATKAS